MTVPTYDQFIEPLLRILASHPEGISSTASQEAAAERVGLTEEDKSELLPSGRQAMYKNRIGWAHDRLKRGGLSSSPKRGYWRITDKGLALAAQHPVTIAPEVLDQLVHVPPDSRLRDPDGPDHPPLAPPPSSTASTSSPEERILEAIRELHESVAADLLEAIAAQTPAFFEKLVLTLLHSLGYGVDTGAIHQVGRAGDGGIDGIISLDRLGFEKVYVQAKRWQNTIGRPEIQGFFGALAGHRAKKGVFITTSAFTKEARQYAAQVSDSLVLVDGARLTQLMIEHGVGVSHDTYRVASPDSDFFEDG
jgi:restriction system protein